MNGFLLTFTSYKCPTGSSCLHGACVDSTCAANSNAGRSCGEADNGCFCASDSSSAGYCVLDVSSCGEVVGWAPDECEATKDCRGGYICAESPECGRRLCLNAVDCIGEGGFRDITRDSKDDSKDTSEDSGDDTDDSNEDTNDDSDDNSDNSSGDTNDVTFPPKVTPAGSPKSGWQLTFIPFVYIANEFNLPKDWYMEYDNKLTVNTRCIAVGELEFSPVSAFPKNAHFNFETENGEVTPNADTCCLALFEGTKCDPDDAGSKHRFICKGAISQPIPFDTKSWMVYGCTGLWTGKLEY